jgi:uncharacterized protein (TIGR02996 family)
MKDNRLAEAFLQAIHANPEDDTPRLVYADWLEEHGDAARAEFIRVQCEKARLPRWHRRWPLLAWRERVLLNCHGHLWQAELPTIEGVQWTVFERGFIHEVHADTPRTLLDNVSKIRSAAPIRWATIGTWEEPAGSPADLSFLVGLRLTDGGDDIYNHPDRISNRPCFPPSRRWIFRD